MSVRPALIGDSRLNASVGYHFSLAKDRDSA
jgi:hypothetical protein